MFVVQEGHHLCDFVSTISTTMISRQNINVYQHITRKVYCVFSVLNSSSVLSLRPYGKKLQIVSFIFQNNNRASLMCLPHCNISHFFFCFCSFQISVIFTFSCKKCTAFRSANNCLFSLKSISPNLGGDGGNFHPLLVFL